jgi:transposase-like protein
MHRTPKNETREVKGMAIMSIESSIKRINKLHYKVKSQSSTSEKEKWYDIVKKYGHNKGGLQKGEWICTCPDFTYRHIICKHIYAVTFSKQLRKKIVSQDVVALSAPTLDDVECPKCKLTENIVKDGKRYNKKRLIQKYLCRICNYRFVINVGFENSKNNPKIICAAIDLYFKGVSLRKVADHIKQFYNVSIHNTSVLRWIQRFGEEVSPFVDSLNPPHLSGLHHIDEMVVHVRREKIDKGNYQWLWNLMDNTTRFWISSKISQRREIIDARKVFQDAKSKTSKPKAVIHDGLWTYNEAFQKEYYTKKNPRVKNIRSISVRNEGLNSVVERLNNHVRDREKTMRGMHNKESAQKMIDAMRIHYNFCREHSKFKKTPSEQAGIKMDIKNNRIETLFRLSSLKKGK